MEINWSAAITAFFASLPATLTALAVLIKQLKTDENVKKIEVATNSMKDALVAATKAEGLAVGHAKGVADERANVRQRTDGA